MEIEKRTPGPLSYGDRFRSVQRPEQGAAIMVWLICLTVSSHLTWRYGGTII